MSAAEWFTLFMLAGLVMVVMEVFLPGWVAGTAALLCMVAAAVSAFPAFGFQGGLLACILLMAGSLLFVWAWFRARMGKSLILRTEMDPQRQVAGYPELLGQAGVAVTRLAPGGIARFGSRRIDVLSDGQWVQPGESVQVVKVIGRAVTVRKGSA
jgi:membrane-bound serine protease (ClpP class)